jgi:hypothetical protein
MASDSKKMYSKKKDSLLWKTIFISLLIVQLVPYFILAIIFLLCSLIAGPCYYNPLFHGSVFLIEGVASTIISGPIGTFFLPIIDLIAVSLYIIRQHPTGKAKATSYVVLIILVLYIISYIIYQLWFLYTYTPR